LSSPFTHSFRSRLKCLGAVLGLAGLFGAGSLMLAPAALLAQGDVAEVPLAELMKPGDLPELSVGSADAKVTIVEYFSMTCPHCADFANRVYPELKKKYIDTGKVRFVFREFPHNSRAYAASMLARCAGGSKTIPMIEGLFETQESWAFQKEAAGFKSALLDVAKQSGFTQESFDKCLTDQKLLDQISAQHARATEKFGLTRIPTLFVNGKKLVGEPSLAALDKMLEPLLPKS
jgi:protein-disulfide isomerase